MPSGPNARRWPQWPRLSTFGTWRQITVRSCELAAAIAVEHKPGARHRGAIRAAVAGLRVTHVDDGVAARTADAGRRRRSRPGRHRRLWARRRCRRRACCPTSSSLSAPFFSVTSRRPSGRKVMAQGSSKLATGVATKALPMRTGRGRRPLQAALSAAQHRARWRGHVDHACSLAQSRRPPAGECPRPCHQKRMMSPAPITSGLPRRCDLPGPANRAAGIRRGSNRPG